MLGFLVIVKLAQYASCLIKLCAGMLSVQLLRFKTINTKTKMETKYKGLSLNILETNSAFQLINLPSCCCFNLVKNKKAVIIKNKLTLD